MEPFDLAKFAAEVHARLREVAPGLRKYASHWEWPDKAVKEQGVAEDLAKSLAHQGGAFFQQPHSNHDDPPDVIATGAGGMIGLEMRELVSREAIETNQRGQSVYWDPDLPDVVAEIHHILADKDRNNYKGGPFSELVLVIHTDEPGIDYNQLRIILETYEFPATQQITKAYVLFSYDPRMGTYPSIPLRLSRAGDPRSPA